MGAATKAVSSFKGHDLITCESKVQVVVSTREYSRELVSFVRHREQVSFDPLQVTRSSPVGHVFGLSGISILFLKNRQGKFLQLRACRR